MTLYAGIDLHSNNSYLCVIDGHDQRHLERSFENDAGTLRSTDGKMYMWLFAGDEHAIPSVIRDEGVNDDMFRATLASIWGKRVDRYSETREFISTPVPKVEMSYIGGYFYKQ